MQPTPTRLSALPLHVPASWLRSIAPRFLGFGLFAWAGIVGGCRDPKVTTYSVPKETLAELPASAPAQPAMAAANSAMPADATHAGMGSPSAAMPNSMGLQTAAGDGLAWTAPAAWQSKPAAMMRKATYVVGSDGATAEVAVTAFPGDVGGEVANVNRWRGQVGLAAVSDAEAAAAIVRIDANGLKIGVVDVVDGTAANPTHLVGAMVPYQGATWFFKLLGPDAVVAKAKPAFIDFVKTIKPATP